MRHSHRFLIALTLLSNLFLTGVPALAGEALMTLVNKANGFAEAENYAEAVPLYEQAVKLAPGEATLKKNLSVLYFNYAVQLQNEKAYEKADSYLEKAMALRPDDPHPKKARAAGFYYRAQDLREAGVESGTPDYPAIEALLEKAIALDAEEKAFPKMLASVYLGRARSLAEQEQFTEAIPLLKKALALDPDSPAVRQSLLNVYLGLAMKDPENKKQWTDEALALDPSDSTRQKVDEILLPKLVSQTKAQAKSILPGNGKKKPSKEEKLEAQLPPQAAEMSVHEMLRDIENQLGMEIDAKETLISRLEALENQVYGKPQTGVVNVRAKALYAALFGTGRMLTQGGLPHLVQAPVETDENSYLDEVFRVTEGKVIRWGRFPLRIYIDEPEKDSPVKDLYKEAYKQAVLDGLERWKAETNNFITYVTVKNPQAADVQFLWGETYEDRFIDEEKPHTTYDTYTPPKRTKWMQALQVASMLTPGYFGLAPQALAASMQYKQMKKIQVIIDESKVTLGLKETEGLPEETAVMLIRNRTAHEFGHILGIKAHSVTPGDLMFALDSPAETEKTLSPSNRDIRTLQLLYNRPPNILLNVR